MQQPFVNPNVNEGPKSKTYLIGKMNMMFQRLCVFVFFILGATALNAADEGGKFAIKGIGNSPCSQFLTETKANSKSVYLYVGWMNGYLTAQNQHMKNNFDLTSWENIHTLGDYLRNYCKKRPRDSFYIAAASMVSGLHKDRVKEYSKTIKINENQDGIIIYESSLKKMQEKLKTLGLYKGEIDGEYGQKVEASVKEFQKRNKLDETGIPDQRTLHAILRK